MRSGLSGDGMLALAVHGLALHEESDRGSQNLKSTTFCGGTGIEAAETPTVRGSFEQCTNFQRIGCVLAWWMIAGRNLSALDCFTKDFWECWQACRAAQSRSSRPRARGATYPLREGELAEFVETVKVMSLQEATSADAVRRWALKAWMFLVFVGLNSLSGTVPLPPTGRWSQVEAQAARSIHGAVETRCHKDIERLDCSEEAWKKDMSSRLIGYGGEEISVCEKLSLEQIVPGLPPGSHGASVDALEWVGPRTRYFLLNPKELLKRDDDVVLPKMPGRVHVCQGEELGIAWELVKRNICVWIPLEKVHQVGSQPILNGLFGVSKTTLLDDGRPVLRLIMNLVGSNATQEQLVGGCSTLPSITSWQSIALEDGETLSCFQSDMSSAFYLFRIPCCWHPHLAFNIITTGVNVNGDPNQLFALACNVIPMGWQSSVGVMQEISENLMKHASVGPAHQLMRGKTLPPWMNETLEQACEEDKHWWHIYLDNFAAAERVTPSNAVTSAELCHREAERVWKEAGVISSSKKRLVDQPTMVELGAEVDGAQKVLGVTTEKLVRTIQATLWLIGQQYLNRKHVQVVAGRWVFILQFRRPAMSVLNETWKLVGGACKVTAKLRCAVRNELLTLVYLSPLLFCNLGAGISEVMMASDASEKGGAVGVARCLSEAGKDFAIASTAMDRSGVTDKAPILLVSLFNGVGGCYRCYDVAGVLPAGQIAVEIDEGANRVCSRRWPDVEIVRDIHLVARDMVRSWSRKYLGITEVHVWSGFPCTDLSGVKANRENLWGKNSRLFYEVPRVTNLVKEEFGTEVTVKEVVENVASMDETAAREISEELGMYPYRLDPVQAVPMRRPRFCWTSETLEGVCPDVRIESGRYWREVIAEAPYPEIGQWIDDGFRWEGGERGCVLPTCLKAIPHRTPPPRPAGLQKCDWDTCERWRSDCFRYPPYQYQQQFLFTSDSSWRLVNANEKELLLGYGYRHTEVAWSASRIKQDRVGYSDARNSYMGDCFSIYSFVLLAVACCKKFLPTIPYKLLTKRMGLAPGFRAPLRWLAPLRKQLSYGSPITTLDACDGNPQKLNRILLRRTNHTGSDVRISSGELMNQKAFPRQSAQASWWKWEPAFGQAWKRKAHINVLEMEALLLSVQHQVQRFHQGDCSIFHLTDSYVTMSVASKGRTSSLQLRRVMRRLAALLLGHGLTLILAHVESTENPTDRQSRAW